MKNLMDAKIDAYIALNPKHWLGIQAMTRERLERTLVALYVQREEAHERTLAITKLQEAAMWLGMDLKRLNEANPYPNSKDPSNTKIEPTADGLKL